MVFGFRCCNSNSCYLYYKCLLGYDDVDATEVIVDVGWVVAGVGDVEYDVGGVVVGEVDGDWGDAEFVVDADGVTMWQHQLVIRIICWSNNL